MHTFFLGFGLSIKDKLKEKQLADAAKTEWKYHKTIQLKVKNTQKVVKQIYKWNEPKNLLKADVLKKPFI